MINFIILNSIVILTSRFLARRFFYSAGLPERVCSFSILFLAQVVFSELILGVFGALFIKNLILLNFFILVFVWLAFRKKSAAAVPGAQKFNWIIKNKTMLFCLAAILGFLLVKSFYNLINPSFGWDSLNYHFTFPVEWLKSGNFYNPPTISDDPSPTYYPINGCLFYYWLIAPFRNVFLADLGQVPFFLLAFFACYAIAKKFNLSKELSFYSAGIFVIIPNFFKQIEVGYADIIMAALFFVTLNLLFTLNKKFNLKNLILAGISFGLFFGTKTLSLAFSLAFIPFFIYILLKHLKSFKKIAGCGILLFILLLIFGGYGHIRNFVLTGNPLFPLNFTLFGKTIFKGVMPTSTYLVRWTREGYNLMKLFFHEGMGGQLFLLIFPAAFIALPAVLWKKKRKGFDFSLVYFLLLPAILYFIFRYIVPQLWTRFLYPFLGVGAAVAIYTLSTLKVPLKAIRIIVVVCFLSCMAELANRGELVVSLAAAAVLFFSLPYLFKLFKNELVRVRAVALAVIILPFVFSAGQKWYLNNEYKRYIAYAPYWKGAMQAWEWLNNNTEGARVAYTGRPVPFPMYGTNFKNDVYYVSVNAIHPAQLHLYPKGNLNWTKYRYDEIDKVLRRDENYRGKADFNIWHKNLLKENTGYLYVYILEEGYSPIEDEWAKSHPDKFQLIFLNPDAHIYKVISAKR